MSGDIGGNDSGFMPGSPGNIFHRIEFDDFTLQERFDFADPSNPMIDYDIVGVPHDVTQDLLGDARHIDLDFDFDIDFDF